MKIAVHGSYYGRNFGDTLIIKIVVDWIKNNTSHEVVLPFISSEKEASEIGARTINREELNKIDKLVYAGGGYFGEPNKSFIKTQYWYYRNWKRHLSWLNKVADKDKYIVGVGFGPISNSIMRKKVLNLFRESQKVIVRDSKSVEYLRKYGYKHDNLEEGVDLAYSLSSSDNEAKNTNNKIGLHLPVYETDQAKKYYELLKPIIENFDVELVSDQPSSNFFIKDESTLFGMINRDYDVKINEFKSFDKLIQSLGSYKTLITSKLHVGIVSTNLGVPVYSIPNHTKTIRYYKQINYEKYCNPIYEFDDEKHKKVIASIDNIENPKIPKDLKDKVNIMKNDLLKFVNS